MRFVKSSPAFFLPILFALCLGGCTTSPERSRTSDLSARNDWIEHTLRKLPLEDRVAQMLMVKAFGYYYSDESDEFRRILHLVKDRKVGGVAVFQGDVYETSGLLNRLQGIAEVPLLVAGDFEWGSAMRIRRSTRFPDAMALGAAADTGLCFNIGKAIGEETRALGVQMDFAPVADVNVNPANPVINTRSFGEDPRTVARLAAAFASGLRAAGVYTTAKHFPGHGDTDVDSHLDLPVLRSDRARLDSMELVPYYRLIGAGISSVMIGHLSVPALDSRRGLPASLSYPIITGLLRTEMGFGGLIISDAMDMNALVNAFGTDSSAVMAIEAGIDILLMPPDEDAALRAVVSAVRSRRIPEDRINESVRRILAMKWDAGIVQQLTTDLSALTQRIGTPEHLQLAKNAARQSVTLLRNEGVLPLDRAGSSKLLHIIITDAENYRTEIHRSSNQWPNEPAGDYFASLLRKRTTNVQAIRLSPASNDLDFADGFSKAASSGIVLCTIFSKARSGSGAFGLKPALTQFIDSLTRLATPVIALSLGSPYVLSAFSNARASLCVYCDAEVSTEASVEALFGEIPFVGTLPVTIPSLFNLGSGIRLTQSTLRKDIPENAGMNRARLAVVDSILETAVRDSAFPGAQAVIGRDGVLMYNKNFGRQEYDPVSPQISPATMYDLASLTKVIATTSAVMRLYEEGVLPLDTTVAAILPQFDNNGKERITIRNLLLHNGGLPPFKQFYRTCTTPAQVLDSVYGSELIYRTGDSTVYSDFDFIVLGKVIERLTGVTLDRYVDSVFFKPLGMSRTMFNPPASLAAGIAPTERDTVFRKRLVKGFVHDENAYLLGGVSGHAGLFSTASDLAIFAQMILNGGTYGGIRLLRDETIRLFTSRQGDTSSRALGWDTRSLTGYSSAGSLFGMRSFGHTGFTGTSIWFEPDRKIFLILLTNRVYPTRNNQKLFRIRPAVADAVIRSIQ